MRKKTGPSSRSTSILIASLVQTTLGERGMCFWQTPLLLGDELLHVGPTGLLFPLRVLAEFHKQKGTNLRNIEAHNFFL